jgi:hypothetical protein
MSGPDAMHGEMPGFGCPGRPGGELDEPLLDMIFGGRAVPPSAPPEMHELARTLAALAGPAEPGELAGEAAALAAFRFASPAGISPAAPRTARHGARRPARHGPRRQAWRGSRRPVRGRAAVAAALVVAVAALGSAAAYTGVLPRSIEQIAHVTGGAPATHKDVPGLSAASARPDKGRSPGRARHSAGPTGSAGAAQTPGQANTSQPFRQSAPLASRGCAVGPWRYQVTPGAPPRHSPPPPARCPKPAPVAPPYVPATAAYIPAR